MHSVLQQRLRKLFWEEHVLPGLQQEAQASSE